MTAFAFKSLATDGREKKKNLCSTEDDPRAGSYWLPINAWMKPHQSFTTT